MKNVGLKNEISVNILNIFQNFRPSARFIHQNLFCMLLVVALICLPMFIYKMIYNYANYTKNMDIL